MLYHSAYILRLNLVTLPLNIKSGVAEIRACV